MRAVLWIAFFGLLFSHATSPELAIAALLISTMIYFATSE